MDAGDVIGFKTSFNVNKNKFTKNYRDLEPAQKERIIEAATFLSETRIGPKVLKIQEIGKDGLKIEMEKIEPILAGYIPDVEDVEKFKKQVTFLVTQMHNGDWAHGDLHIENLGIDKKGEPVIFDYDTMFHISTGKDEKWVRDWMKNAFDWEDTYDDFVEYDYTNWQSDWLGSRHVIDIIM